MKDIAFVEQNELGLAVRIFRNRQDAVSFGEHTTMGYADAVSDIRHALFIRSQGFCELCGEVLTEKSGQMHEMKHRGKGGEISLENSVFICAKTHRREHADRSPRFTKKSLDI